MAFVICVTRLGRGGRRQEICIGIIVAEKSHGKLKELATESEISGQSEK